MIRPQFRLVLIYIIVMAIGLILSLGAKRGPKRVFHDGTGLASKYLNMRNHRYFSFSSGSWSANLGKTSSSQTVNTSHLDKTPTFDITFAYQPKDREESNVFKLRKAPTAALQSPTGEDNFYVSNVTSAGGVSVGVADGVGGWSEAGYDSSAISRELCSQMKLIFETLADMSPKELLNQSFEAVLKSPQVEIGGTTACLGIFTPDYKLKVANLGDSWCGVFRDYKLIHETNFQTHNFNTPYQLAKIPAQIIRQAGLSGKRYIIDNPGMADEYLWDVKKDDLVLFATDGVTDNVIPKDIEIFLKDNFETSELSQDAISKSFVKEVVKVSKNPNFPSAFAQELSRLTGQKYLGGKEDDITIVLVKVN